MHRNLDMQFRLELGFAGTRIKNSVGIPAGIGILGGLEFSMYHWNSSRNRDFGRLRIFHVSLSIHTESGRRQVVAEVFRECTNNIYSIQIPDRPNLTQRCVQFATASTSTQIALLPWRYDVEMGTANSLHASAYYVKYIERFGFGFKKYIIEINLQKSFINKKNK